MTLARIVRTVACATALLCATAAPAYAFRGMEGSVRGQVALPSTELSTVRTQAVTGPDAYESDDTFSGAITLVPGVESGIHNFYNASPPAESDFTADIDYSKFVATAGHTYRITTTHQGMPAGAYWTSPMELVVDDGGGWGGYGTLQVYSEYENSMGASSSKVVWTCATSGTYYVRVGDWYDEYPDTEYTILLDDLGAVPPGSVSRIAGTDRYKTAAKLAMNSAGTYAGVTKFVIASGLDKSMPDAMTASGLAGALNAPVVLVRPDLKSLPAATKDAIATAAALNRGKTIQFHIIGGTASVPAALEKQLRSAALGKATIERISGPDRYSTAAAVAAHIRKHVPEYLLTAFVANGENPAFFSDALTASPVAAQLGAPILLVKSKGVPAATAAALRYYPNRIMVGSENKALSTSVGRTVLGSDFSKGAWITGYNRAAIARHFAEFWEYVEWDELPLVSHYTVTNSLADALTAGSSPRLGGNYILFVDKTITSDGTVAYASDQFIQVRRLAPPQLTIVGGTGTVDSRVEGRLKDLVGDRFSVLAHESGGTFVDNGFNKGTNRSNLSSIWTRQVLGGAATYSTEHPAPGSPVGGKITGASPDEFVWAKEYASSGMTSDTAEYRFWIYCDNTSGYRYVLDRAEANGTFYIEWLEGGLIYVYLDRAGSAAPYSNAGYHQIGTFKPGAMQYRVVTNFTNHTYTVSRRSGVGLDWTYLRSDAATNNDIPMRSRTVSRSSGLCFDMCGPGNFWFDEVQFSNKGITDVEAVPAVN